MKQKNKKKDRRDFIKKSSILSGGALFASDFNFSILEKRHNIWNTIIGHGDMKYKVDSDWGIRMIDKQKYPVMDCQEMVCDKKNRLIMLTNETKNNIIIYDRSGKLIKTWGNEYPGAHGLTLFSEGEEEFLFITDVYNNQVYKTTLDGKVIMTIDYPKETGLYRLKKQFWPTEVAVAPNGDFFIVDGYGLQYIIKYDAKGNIITAFGGLGSSEELFSSRWTAHGVAIDNRKDPNNPTLIASSRNENKFKWYTLDGEYIDDVHLPGAYISRPVIDGDNLYSAVLHSDTPWVDNPPPTGFVTILDKENKVVSNPGGTLPYYDGEGKLRKMEQYERTFMHPHDVCVDPDKNLYICQWNSGRTYPVMLERV